MKKILFLMSAAMVALAFVACGGQGAGSNTSDEQTGDSSAVADVQDSVAVADEAVDETAEGAADGVQAEAVLNTSLIGNYSNNADPNIYMVLSDRFATHNGRKGYGNITAYNEYFEPDFILDFTSVTPDGDNIKVHYNKIVMSFEGDPDALGDDEAGEWVEQKAGSGDLTICPAGAGKVKIDSKERRLSGKTLIKQ